MNGRLIMIVSIQKISIIIIETVFLGLTGK